MVQVLVLGQRVVLALDFVDPLLGLGEARTVANFGAGAGSYEPADRVVVAVEPSPTMIGQRLPGAAPAVRASALSLPFPDASFDAALAVLTVHHWPRRRVGLRELRRIACDRVVILTCDPAGPGFWLMDYFPEMLEIDRRILPTVSELERELGPLSVRVVPIPHDCTDGFLGAYWRRPAAYLGARVRAAISAFAKLSDTASGLERLGKDLASGEWQRRYGAVLNERQMDLGYRLVVAADLPRAGTAMPATPIGC